MSSTTYQTNAKPRGRRGSHGEASDKPARSRASSSASTKLSKTLSRTLDEVSIPRNSRPSSPAVYDYRQRTLDPKKSDPAVASMRQSALSLKSDRSVQSQPEPDTSSTPVSPVKSKPHVVQDVHQFEVHEPGRRSVSPSKLKKHVILEPAHLAIEDQAVPSLQQPHPSPGLGRKTHSSRSLAAMQPTVAEEMEEFGAPEITPLSPKPPRSIPIPADVVVSSARMSKSSLHEEDVEYPSRTSGLSWHDITSVSAIPTSSSHELAVPISRTSIDSLQHEGIYASPRNSRSSLQDTMALPHGRSSGSSLHEPLTAPTPQGPLVFMQPSLDQRLAESVERGIPVTASPAPAAGVAQLHDFIPQTQSPLGSPPLSPYLHQPMGSPPPQSLQYAQPYPYQYPLSFTSNFPPTFYPTPFTSPTMPFYNPGEIARAGSAGAEDERTKLLEKVSNVLPDINRLLHYYSESQGLLSEKDNLVKQTETQHMEETARLRIELSACKEEYEKIIGEQASENLRLKKEISEQAEKIASLQASSHASAKSDEELADLRSVGEKLEKEIEVGRSVNERLVTEKRQVGDGVQELEIQLQEQKSKFESLLAENGLQKDQVETLKIQLHDERMLHETKQADSQRAHTQALAEREEEHLRVLHEHKTALSKVQLDLAGMIHKHTQQKKDLDSAKSVVLEHERVQTEKSRELEDTLRSHATTVAEMRKDGEQKAAQHKQEMTLQSQELARSNAQHVDEIDKLQDAHKKEQEQVHKAAEDRLSDTVARYEQREQQLQSELGTLQVRVQELESDLQQQHAEQDEMKTQLAKARDEHETLKSKHELTDKHHAELADTMLNLKTKQAEWHRESERMDQILHNLRQLTPSTGKSDEFFVRAFNELAQSVAEISKRYFRNEPHLDLATKVTLHSAGLPSITGTSETACAWRCLFLQHQIFSVLHRRVFQPFIFTCDHDTESDYGLEVSLAMMSRMISAKSVRREAVWRAMIMQAFYATEQGRKAASAVATSVSIEVMEKIQSMAPVHALPDLLEAVRMLSKRAVELWRHVRVQWQVIRSSMPSMADMEERRSPLDVLLWIRPHVEREDSEHFAAVENFHSSATAGNIYLQGTALSQDSPIVLARRQELQE
ncbi:hypothetical protein H2200_001734 [Cladophialophora chaetospira]|uniref:Uncharacterized protein n=1 Tax=Cladophialophora chaetospira TaxID=386627 RepID=A0AA38XMH4_9EURO|nr:hypothetical protein H2200_001734 [Cladophialophora chaetospira]